MNYIFFLFFLTLNLFLLPLTSIVPVKKESQYDMKILVVFTTIAKLVYRHEAVTKFSK